MNLIQQVMNLIQQVMSPIDPPYLRSIGYGPDEAVCCRWHNLYHLCSTNTHFQNEVEWLVG